MKTSANMNLGGNTGRNSGKTYAPEMKESMEHLKRRLLTERFAGGGRYRRPVK
jgi:hypothetical protein